MPKDWMEPVVETTVIRYGCHHCLRGHDEFGTDVHVCPHCGGITEPMPADEQPTAAARRLVERSEV